MTDVVIALPDQSTPEHFGTVGLPDHSARGHSRLGASGAERWMNCPGSVALLKELALPESDEPDYRREGTALHECAAYCLEQGLDAWEIAGHTFNDTVMDLAMIKAVQVYLDYCRKFMDANHKVWIEAPISSPVHPLFYGACDFASIRMEGGPLSVRTVDLKGGEGILVEPDENPQLIYYTFGFIDGMERDGGFIFPDDTPVILAIVQPRGYHADGPIREWPTTVGHVKSVIHDEIVPAMLRTEFDHALDAGEWCRFCPAKLVCPLMTSLFGAAAKANPKDVVQLNDASLGRSFQYIDAVKHYLKALGEEALRRGRAGHALQEHGIKMVYQKSNRVWKEGAAALAKQRFGEKALSEREMLSPPALEKLGQAETEFVKEYAYMPVGNLTVARLADKRPAVKVEPASAVFAGAIANLIEEQP